MITNPDNLFEQLQNELAVQIRTNSLFSGTKMADGTPWLVLTEDEGDIEYLYTQMINVAGLCAIVPPGRPGGTHGRTQIVTAATAANATPVSILNAIGWSPSPEST